MQIHEFLALFNLFHRKNSNVGGTTVTQKSETSGLQEWDLFLTFPDTGEVCPTFTFYHKMLGKKILFGTPVLLHIFTGLYQDCKPLTTL